MKYTDNFLGPPATYKKGSRYSIAGRNAGRASKRLAADKTAAQVLDDIFTALTPEISKLKTEREKKYE